MLSVLSILFILHLASAQRDILRLEKAAAEMVRPDCNHIVCKNMVSQ